MSRKQVKITNPKEQLTPGTVLYDTYHKDYRMVIGIFENNMYYVLNPLDKFPERNTLIDKSNYSFSWSDVAYLTDYRIIPDLKVKKFSSDFRSDYFCFLLYYQPNHKKWVLLAGCRTIIDTNRTKLMEKAKVLWSKYHATSAEGLTPSNRKVRLDYLKKENIHYYNIVLPRRIGLNAESRKIVSKLVKEFDR